MTWGIYRTFQVCANSVPFGPASPWMMALEQGSLALLQVLILHLGHPKELQGWRRVSTTECLSQPLRGDGSYEGALWMEYCLSTVSAEPHKPQR